MGTLLDMVNQTPEPTPDKAEKPIPRNHELWIPDSVSKRLGEEGYPWYAERVNKRIADCPYCHGLGNVRREPKKSDLPHSSKFEACWYCAAYCRRLEDFACVWFLHMPPAYRKHTLKSLQPFAGTADIVSLEKQQGIIDMLRNEPERGWMFFGPPRAGKTTWTSALYAENLYAFIMGNIWKGEISDRLKLNGKLAIWRIKAKTLLDQHTEWSMKRFDKDKEYGTYDTPEPDITPEKIKKYRRLGVKSKLYLEEIDKVNMTEARTNNLFEIVDALHEEEGTVVLNSNLTPEEFTLRFGEQFAWRLNENSNVVTLF